MRSTATIERIENLRGAPVYSTDREKIGTVENVFFDLERNEPRWLALSGGFLSTKSTVVPLHEATFEQDRVVVPFTKEQIRNAPDVTPDAISQHLEQKLFTYYGLEGRMWQDLDPVEAGGTAPEYERLRYRRWEWETPRR
jgi:sporulation protein YlmC with PRC-barrel domain